MLSITAMVAGCNVLGFFAQKTIPPTRVPAEFDLGESPTAVVVTVDQSLSGEYGPMDAEALAVALERALARDAKAKIVGEASASRIVRVHLNPPASHGAIGSAHHSGQASASVRVEADSGTEMWPKQGPEGRVLEAQTPRVRGANAAQIRRATLEALARNIAALFYSREMRSGE